MAKIQIKLTHHKRVQLLPAALSIHHPERKHDKSDFIRSPSHSKQSKSKTKDDINQTFNFYQRTTNVTNGELENWKKKNQQQKVLYSKRKKRKQPTMIKIGNCKQDCQISSAVREIVFVFTRFFCHSFPFELLFKPFNENIMNVLMYSSRSYHQ